MNNADNQSIPSPGTEIEKLIKQVVSLLEKDIELNKNLLGLDFSFFFGNILNVFEDILSKISTTMKTSHQEEALNLHVSETMIFPGIFFTVTNKIKRTAEALEKRNPIICKNIVFPNASNAITAIGQLRCCEIDIATGIIRKNAKKLLSHSRNANIDINDEAIKILLQ